MNISHLPFAALLCVLLVGCGNAKPHPPQVPKTTFSSFDRPETGAKLYGKNEINMKGISTDDLLRIYQETSGRTVIRSSSLVHVSSTFANQTPLTQAGVLQLFDSVLAQHGIVMVLSGDNAVKAVHISAAAQEAGPVINLPADQLPDSSSFMVRIVHLKKNKPSDLVPVVQPFGRVPNGIIAMDREKILVLRDFSSNIRQMLKLINAAEGSGGH